MSSLLTDSPSVVTSIEKLKLEPQRASYFIETLKEGFAKNIKCGPDNPFDVMIKLVGKEGEEDSSVGDSPSVMSWKHSAWVER